MEMGSSSLAESGSSSASSPAIESVNGLNFGKKVYFENVNGAGATGKSGTESSSSGSRGPFARKARSGKQQQQQQQPPSCQVEGCKVDLSDAKPYYSRHRVCGMHSKSPKVIVAGLEQRFCQQCSRFHQLPEFDQGKRSCRRRLAGHNERRRKPPPGSLLSSRDGRFSSTTLGNMNRAGGFLLDFSAYPRPPGRDAWLSQRSSERVCGGQTTGTGRSFVQPWQNSSQTAQSNIYLQGSAGGTGSSGSRIPSGECFPGVNVADSSCALSLLSNQPWGPRNRASGLQVNNLADVKVAPMAQPTAPHDSAANWYPSPSWGFKGNEVSSSSHEMCPNLGLGQISQPLDSQFSSEPRLAQGNSRACDSSAMNMHWSL